MTQFFTYISIEETPVYMETDVLKIEHVFSQSSNIVIQEQVLICVAEIDTTWLLSPFIINLPLKTSNTIHNTTTTIARYTAATPSIYIL